jgi:hypothetical protein
MGLDANVMCNCLRDGLAQPFELAELLTFDEDGYLDLDLPYEGNEPAYALFDRWLESGCIHRRMRYANEYLSNWGGYRLFQQALEDAGWEHFPVLHGELPNANGGSMSSELAVLALRELDFFRQRAQLSPEIVLVDTDTGAALYSYVRSYGGVFYLSGAPDSVNAGLDEQGFFVVERDGLQRELFRARSFEQLVDPETSQAEYRALDGGDHYVSPRSFINTYGAWPDGRRKNDEGQLYVEHPRHLHVEERPQTGADFDYILRPLTVVLEASVATGNPVRWT